MSDGVKHDNETTIQPDDQRREFLRRGSCAHGGGAS